MGNVNIEPRPKGRAEGTPIEDYVVEDHKDHVLKTFKTQKGSHRLGEKRGPPSPRRPRPAREQQDEARSLAVGRLRPARGSIVGPRPKFEQGAVADLALRRKKDRPKAALKEAREGDRRLYAAVVARRPFPAVRSADSPSPPKPTSISAQVEGSGTLRVAIVAVMEILFSPNKPR